MAWGITGTNFGTSEKVSDTSISVAVAGTSEAGNVLIVAVGIDNLTTTDGETTDVSVSDSQGNTYTRIKEQTNGNAAAAAGATVALFFSKLATALVEGNGDTVTATIAGAVTAKGIGCFELTIGAGNVVSVAGSTSGVGDNADPAALTISDLASQEYLWLYAIALEGPNSDTWTPDADYTSQSGGGTSGGGAATNINLKLDARIFSSTTDTYDGSNSSNRDHAHAFAALKEAAAAARDPGRLSLLGAGG